MHSFALQVPDDSGYMPHASYQGWANGWLVLVAVCRLVARFLACLLACLVAPFEIQVAFLLCSIMMLEFLQREKNAHGLFFPVETFH